jgi:hypothetical protein
VQQKRGAFRPGALVLVLALLPLGCGKKGPSADECGRAWRHVRELQIASVQAQIESAADQPDGATTPEAEQALKAMAESARGMAARTAQDPSMTRFESALSAACQAGSEATAKCVLDARSVDDLVKECRMKASPGPRGGVSLSWPD